MTHPATEWLRARLGRGPSDSQAVIDAATGLRITPDELRAARVTLRVVEETRGAPGEQYTMWSLPPGQPVVATVVPPGATRADLVTTKKRTPKEAVEKAKNSLRRRAPRYAQYLDELSRKASEDAVPCPTCGRGTPRSEEVRLRAVVAALDRSGVVAPRGEGDDGVPAGPVIVFPPGTTIGVLVQTPPAPIKELRLTRGDELRA